MKNIIRLILKSDFSKISNKFIYITFIILPLLFYFGDRSFIAYDEGYYALQGKWILESGNWIAPQWFDQVQFDRPPVLPVFLAVCYRLFGYSHFSAHLTSLCFSFIVLYLTFKIHKELLESEYQWISPLILITTYLWINYTHLINQELLLVAVEMLGIYYIIKTSEKSQNYIYLLSTVWIGIGFFIKTYMIIIPIIAILPYVLIFKRFLLKKYYFWLGILIGFIPVIVWGLLCFDLYGMSFVEGINNKLISLSRENTFSQPFYYYIWNILLSLLPWTPFCINGIFKTAQTKLIKNYYFILIYPLLIIILLSLFETKTPYYTLQVIPFFSILCSKSLLDFCFNISNQNLKIIKKYSKNLIFSLIIIFVFLISLRQDLFNNKIFSASLLSFLILLLPLQLIKISIKRSKLIYFFIIGPYLVTLIFVQTGILNNRSPEIKSAMELFNNSLINNNINIVLYQPNKITGKELSELIKISLYSSFKIKRIPDPKNLESNQLLWITKNDIKLNENLKVIFKDERISKWVLVKEDNIIK